MTGDNTTDGTERPEGWPEHYMGEATLGCSHYMMWDTAEGRYVCIYECGTTADEPPESKIDSDTDRRGDE